VRTIAVSVGVAFDVAFLGYLLTFSLWWFLLPVLAFALAWRRCYRAWPLLGPSQWCFSSSPHHCATIPRGL